MSGSTGLPSDSGDDLLRGASDLHVHASPEVVMSSVDEVTTATLARDVGMRALVFKPFLWPTVRSAQLIESLVPGMKVYGGVTLNFNSGGLDPAIVDAAGRLGGKVVWMPTFSSANDLQRGGFSATFQRHVPLREKYPAQGISILGEDGALKPEVREIVRLAKEHDLILSTGHLAPYESKCLASEARTCGFRKLIFSHPLIGAVGATLDDIKEMAELGAYVEHTAITAFSKKKNLTMDQIVQGVLAASPDRTIITSDATHPENPPGPTMMRTFLISLMEHGVKRDDLSRMVRDNPAFLLGL